MARRGGNNDLVAGLVGATVAGNVSSGPGTAGMFFGACSGDEDPSLFCKTMQAATVLRALLYVLFVLFALFVVFAFVRGGGLRKLYKRVSNAKF